MTATRVVLGGILLWAAVVALPGASRAADVYETRGEEGEPLFTDRPAPGATKRHVNPNVIKFKPPPPSPTAPETPPPPADEPPSYEIALTKPAPEATVRDNAGRVEVAVAVTPELRDSETVQIFLDGEPAGDPGRALSRTLANVDRGAHRVHAVVKDEQGAIIASSRGVTFYLHRVSRLTRPPPPDLPGGAAPATPPGPSQR